MQSLLSKKILLPAMLTTALCGDYSVTAASAQVENGCEPVSSAKRRRPGQQTVECVERVNESSAESAQPREQVRRNKTETQSRSGQKRYYSGIPTPRIEDYQTSIVVPDRWRIVDSLGYRDRWYDPYNRNVYKGDKPVYGKDWFFAANIISDSVYENRKVVTPVGLQATNNPGSNDVLGSFDQQAFNQNLLVELIYYKGDTTFRPPDWEFRIIPVFNYNYADIDEVTGVNADVLAGDDRDDDFIGLQTAFVDYHIRDVSKRYDFDSIRIGIQPYAADFRGFLFQDSPFGVRLFGNRDNNIFQYNIAWFRRMEKDTNSGLNDHNESLRDDDIFTANLYWQDLFFKGLISEFNILYNKNREDEIIYDNNEFIVRPASIGTEILREYDVTYLGYAAEGHINRLNVSFHAYAALGQEEGSLFRNEETEIRAFFTAAELGYDFDWIRLRGSLLWASGDSDPFDDKAEGFDAIFENPLFAGADTSYWIRQGIPLAGGGRVALSGRNAVLPSLRSTKEQGQSNFTNPGLFLLGIGADFDLTPESRISLTGTI